MDWNNVPEKAYWWAPELLSFTLEDLERISRIRQWNTWEHVLDTKRMTWKDVLQLYNCYTSRIKRVWKTDQYVFKIRCETLEPNVTDQTLLEFHFVGLFEHPCLISPVQRVFLRHPHREEDHYTYMSLLVMPRFQALRLPSDYTSLLSILRDVLHALITLHDHHILHRDLKISNLVYDEDTRHVRLIDMEWCCYDYITPKLARVCTLGYRSPVLAQHITEEASMQTCSYGYEVDIFAFGQVLTYLLQGSCIGAEKLNQVHTSVEQNQVQIQVIQEFLAQSENPPLRKDLTLTETQSKRLWDIVRSCCQPQPPTARELYLHCFPTRKYIPLPYRFEEHKHKNPEIPADILKLKLHPLIQQRIHHIRSSLMRECERRYLSYPSWLSAVSLDLGLNLMDECHGKIVRYPEDVSPQMAVHAALTLLNFHLG